MLSYRQEADATSTSIRTRGPPVKHFVHSIFHMLFVWKGQVLQILRIRRRHIGAGDSQDRRIEVIESIELEDVNDLRPHPAERPTFLHNDRSVRLLYRLHKSYSVERAERSRVNHLHIDTFSLQVGGGFQCHEYHLGMSDQSYVLALPFDVGDSQWNQTLALGNFAARSVKHLRLNKDHRIVVTNGRLQQSFGVRGCRGHDHL